MSRIFSAARGIRLALYALLSIVTICACSVSCARGQISSGFGGDARGKQSNLEVTGLRHVPIGTGSPSPDEALIFVGGEWGPHPIPAGSPPTADSAGLTTYRVTLTSVTGSITDSSTNSVTVSSFVLKAGLLRTPAVIRYRVLGWMYGVSGTTGPSQNMNLWLNGKLVASGQSSTGGILAGAPHGNANVYGEIYVTGVGTGGSILAWGHSDYGTVIQAKNSIIMPYQTSTINFNVDQNVEITWKWGGTSPVIGYYPRLLAVETICPP